VSASTAAHAAPVRPGTAAPGTAAIRRLSGSGLAWGAAASLALVTWIVLGVGGARYYLTPLKVRAYDPLHALLRPSGPIGQTLGVAGTVLLLVPFLYMARKRLRGLRGSGPLQRWLELHLFCGVFGPVLITFHTSFKFNGLISAAYWSMVIVMLSGFVGRYIYVRIPRSIRGHELTRAELDAQLTAWQDELAGSSDSPAVLGRIDAFERESVPADDRLSFVDQFFGDLRVARRLRALDLELQAHGVAAEQREALVRLASERSVLLRRVAYLRRTRRLFDLWHVFHLPLVYLLLVIATAHIGLALYLGYVPFRW